MLISRSYFLICVTLVTLAVAAHQKKATPQTPSHEDDRQFSVIQGEMDGHPLFAMIASDLKQYPSKSKFPWFLSLSTPLMDSTLDGLPQGKDFDALNAWEDEMEARIAKAGKYYYVGHVTWKGSREALFYLEKQEPVVTELKKVRDSHSSRPFAFVCEKDEGWKKVSPYLQSIEHQSSK